MGITGRGECRIFAKSAFGMIAPIDFVLLCTYLQKFYFWIFSPRRSVLYLVFMLVLSGTCDRTALLKDYMIAEKVSALGKKTQNNSFPAA